MSWVRVALPVALDQEFTYRLRQEGAAPVGARVIVPFGPRRMAGFVTAALTEPDVDASLVKDVERVLPDAPLEPSLMRLARFVADYYACPLGEVLRTVAPAGAAPARRARITDAGRAALAAGPVRGERRHAALEALAAAQDGLSLRQLAQRAGKGAPAAIASLVRDGLAEVGAPAPAAPKPLVVHAWRLGGGGLISAPARRATVAERVRDALASAPEPRTAAELAEAVGAHETSVRQALKRLEESGAAVREDRVLERVPEAPATAGPAPVRELTPGQAEALRAATELADARAFGVLLIEGVTGSGKTEVYLRAIEHAIAASRTCLYLVPEIAITPLLMRTIRARFGARTAILHSGLSDGERHDERARILRGDVDVVVGARSAVFAPVPRLGLVVVDEEHEASYKQDTVPRYHGRDVAIMRASLEGAACVLGSATPSLESYRNALTGRYRLVRLPVRAGGAQPAHVELVDMRVEWRATKGAMLSRALAKALDETLASGRQAMMLLNRRGWADFVLCRECGEPERCDRCAVSLTVHLRERTLLCHYCDLHRDIPERCRNCGGTFLQNVGQGTEQLEKELGAIFPGVTVARLDADVARKKGAAASILASFEAGRIQVLAGTQMIAKGHDFPGVTLVGVLQADRALWLPDFRASERTFQLITQVAGRAGRRKDPGRVIVQTYSPQHPAIAMAAEQDYPRFYAAESEGREALAYPPFTRLVSLLASGPERSETDALSQRLAGALRDAAPSSVTVLGPAPAPLARIKERWRFQVMLKATGHGTGQALVRKVLGGLEVRDPLRVDVDVDPQSLL